MYVCMHACMHVCMYLVYASAQLGSISAWTIRSQNVLEPSFRAFLLGLKQRDCSQELEILTEIGSMVSHIA